MAHWLVKSEPSSYSWSDLQRDGRTSWDGVRNYQARNNLAAMREGDSLLVYHSVGDKEVVGVARVVREAYPDRTADAEQWVAVDIVPLEALARPVRLDEIKSHPELRDIALVRQGRLSVMPLTPAEFRTIVGIAKRDAPSADGKEPAAHGKKTGYTLPSTKAAKTKRSAGSSPAAARASAKAKTSARASTKPIVAETNAGTRAKTRLKTIASAAAKGAKTRSTKAKAAATTPTRSRKRTQSSAR